MSDKYNVTNYSVENLLGYIKAGEIAVPEIQRPFVWSGKQVRDLIDSLYNGYPTGYLIIWQNPNVRLKNGENSGGKKILIDGQQRVTALMTAIVGQKILTENYEEKIIRIAFNPVAKNEDELFAVTSAAHDKDKAWISDISTVFAQGFSSHKFINQYLKDNPDADEEQIENSLDKLRAIAKCQLGVIQLVSDLSINDVTEIFVRINSQGKRLNEADFAMSKIAADSANNGMILRKAIDYFCRLIVDKSFYKTIENGDEEFMQSEYAQKISWLKKGIDDIYTPDYSDMLRVSCMNVFIRGKLSVLVGLLSGRDFEERTYKAEIMVDSFQKLNFGISNFVKKYNFTQFISAIKSAGFITPKILTSKITLDFAYTLFLLLQQSDEVEKTKIKSYVQKWFVLSTLTGRYITSSETQMDRDLREIAAKGFKIFFAENERALLPENFWKIRLVQNLETSSVTSPYFNVYLAAQNFFKDHSLLSNSFRVENLMTEGGDIHHIFPKEYLRQNGFDDKNFYNQVANYAYLDKPLNITIGKLAPNEYFPRELEKLGEEIFYKNLEENCIPPEVINMTVENYKDFLRQRRILMAQKIQKYYAVL